MLSLVGVPILEYHDLSDVAESSGGLHAPYILSVARFEEQMHWLASAGYRAVSLEKALAGQADHRSVVLTFDDGHRSNYEYAFPILRHYGFTATFFIVSGFLDQPSYLSKDQLSELGASFMSIGSHSNSHPYILALPDEQAREELIVSKELLEKLTKKAVQDFCVPYGFYNRKLAQMVRDSGYRSLVTEDFGYHYCRMEGFSIVPRFTIKASTSIQTVQAIVMHCKRRLIVGYTMQTLLHTAKHTLGFERYVQARAFLMRSFHHV